MSTHRFRIVTYNVHRCRGLDGRVSPGRIAEILKSINADVIALQEVLSIANSSPEADQAVFLASQLGFDYCLGNNRRVRGGVYGNVVLSRFPIVLEKNFDISCRDREPRGCLQTDLRWGHRILHIFNVHLGTAFFERRQQARTLMNILGHASLGQTRIILGDFNEWTYGLASRLLGNHLVSADVRHHLRRSRTYPGFLPFLHLDHIYFDRSLKLHALSWVRDRSTLVASDHLPLFADFTVGEEPR